MRLVTVIGNVPLLHGSWSAHQVLRQRKSASCHVVECFSLPNELLTLYVLAPSPDLKDFYENDETRDTL